MSSRIKKTLTVTTAILAATLASQSSIFADDRGKYELVISKTVDGNTDLYLTHADGSNPFRLTNDPQMDVYASWSPKGDKIAYLSEGEGTAGNIFILDLEAQEKQLVVENTNSIPSWSPDGTKIIITNDTEKGSEMAVVDLKSGEKTIVNTSAPNAAFATWSPVGPHIVFEASADDNPEIFSAHVSGRKTKRLTNNPTLDEWPVYSPGGEYIAYASGTEETKNMWIMRSNGSGHVQATKGVHFWDAYPTWSPIGDVILFTAVKDDNVGIYKFNIRNRKTTFLTEGMMPNWRK